VGGLQGDLPGFASYLQSRDIVSQAAVDESNGMFMDLLTRVAKSCGMWRECCPLREHSDEPVRPKWFDGECKAAKRRLKEALSNGMAGHLYRQLRQEYRALTNRKKKRWTRHQASQLLDMLEHGDGDAWKLLRQKDKRVQSAVGINKWHAYLQEHFVMPKAAPPPVPQAVRRGNIIMRWEGVRGAHDLAVPVGRRAAGQTRPAAPAAQPFPFPDALTMESLVRTALSSMRVGTSPGQDGLTVPFIKEACLRDESGGGPDINILVPVLATWFLQLIKVGKVPSAWKSARISPLFKDGDPTDPGRYRMLAVNGVLYRLYANVLRDIITGWCKDKKAVPDTQFGFYPGRSTAHPTFVLRHIIEAQRHAGRGRGKRIYVAFIDFSAAYDHISRTKLWEHLHRKVGIPQVFAGGCERAV
jgi:hypothetical protein